MKKYAFSFLSSALLAAVVASPALAQDVATLQTTSDEALLLQAIDGAGSEPADIHRVNVAVKRLAVIGSEASIPKLVALLANEKQSFNARFALEALPFDAADAALAEAAGKLDGACLVGVIDSIGVRGKAESVALLTKLYAEKDDVAVKKAVVAALGAIASDEAAGFLVSEAKKDLNGADPLFLRGLGDAILDAAEAREKAGNLVGAAALYDAATTAGLPNFVREAGTYRALVCRGAESAAKIVELIKSDDQQIVDAALKTVREFKDADAPKVVETLLAAFDSFPEAKQILVLRALGDRKDDASKKLVFPKAVALAKDGSVALKIAAAKALINVGSVDTVAAFDPFEAEDFDDKELGDAIVALGVALDDEKFAAQIDEAVGDLPDALDEFSEAAALGILKIVELRRVESAGPVLVKIAETKQGAVRDAALAALSEIVSLDNLDLLVAALDGETDDAKVDWILRAACTRMPREECAAKVADLFAKETDLDAKNKTLPLLKQIGGPTALAAVAAACNGPTVDKATQILGEWNTPSDAEAVADVCLKIAQQARDAKYHSRGIRGYIRIPRQFDMPVARKIEMCKIAFETARRAEDKALIFEVFKRNIVAENVVAALEYAKHDEFKEAACEAAVVVAEKIRVSQPEWKWDAKTDDAAKAKAGKDLIDGMKRVVDTTSNADLKARAQKLL
ncbi:MAG: hypothetical protein J6K20_14555 [Thermoguttaceae bacterium]|nr:hypothetical protein [Thermoguttaceae bacterium]